jgi:hypothetical protein
MAEFNRGTPPFRGDLGPNLPLSRGPAIGWQVGLDGNADPVNVMDNPVPRQEPGRPGQQPTLSGAQFAPGLRK